MFFEKHSKGFLFTKKKKKKKHIRNLNFESTVLSKL